MGIRIRRFASSILVIGYLGIFLSCATNEAPLPIRSGLVQNKLAYYYDSFDSFREDIWEKSSLALNVEQMGNIKAADMTIENGRLRIDTKTGSFSKGCLTSKFALRGDFDVMVDIQINFVPGDLDMDQSLTFGTIEKTLGGTGNRLICIGLSKRGQKESRIFSGYLEYGKYHAGYWDQINHFTGSVRLVRNGDQVSAFYRKQGQNYWTKTCTLRSSEKDALIGLALQNFVQDRKSIIANRSISAWIDNFTINAAQEIIESEI